ncbi:CAP domain-containing protein [Streptomyces griseosporeus]|uniref:CAP domain-containing protein n=1 Tax=Streptomyces griseosporeus TaxID=1910 RepID=UPI0036FD4F17
MGRHRRSAAGRAATGRATGVTHTDGSWTDSHIPGDSYGAGDAPMGIAPYLNPEAYAEAYAKSQEYLFATDEHRGGAGTEAWAGAEAGAETGAGAFEASAADTAVLPSSEGFAPEGGGRRSGPHRRRKKKAVTPVRTGLLGVSAAVAIGTVAVASGVVPGLDNYRLGGGSGPGDKVQAADGPTNSASEQGGVAGTADDRTAVPGSASRGGERSSSPSASTQAPSPSASTASPTPTKTPSAEPTTPTPSEKPTERATPEPKPTPSESKERQRTSAPVTVSAEAAAEAEVLRLVNEERAKVGCSPVAANSGLTQLAEAFSQDMAARNFFDHTDPDGRTPWDRAAKAGITDLGGENIARGQADAAAVMEAWMNSPGHRANILNCDFKTLGVGVHLGAGGPWWTQDFGY